MGINTFQVIENGEVIASTSLRVHDFIPIVNVSEERRDSYRLKSKDEVFNLEKIFKKEFQEYKIPEIWVLSNDTNTNNSKETKKKAYIKLKVLKGTDHAFDDSGIIEFQCNNDKVTITPSSKEVDFGDEIIITIEHDLEIEANFSVKMLAKDKNVPFDIYSDAEYICGKLNFTVKEFLYDIPTIVTGTFNCTENCNSTTEPGETKGIWDKSIKSKKIRGGLDLFSQTKIGQSFLSLFMEKDEKFYSFTNNENGNLFNKHSLFFAEVPYEVNLGHTYYYFKQRHWNHNDLNNFCNKRFQPSLEAFNKEHFLLTQIFIYEKQFSIYQNENSWSDKRTIGQIAHTIAHEVFIHGFRKGIIEALEQNDFNKVISLASKDLLGEQDHTDYINRKKTMKDYC